MNDKIIKTENMFYVIPKKVIELKRAEEILKNQNEWLWDNTGLIPQLMTDPKELRRAIDVILSENVECICGWEGKKKNLYYREKNEKFDIAAKLECPKCFAELVS